VLGDFLASLQLGDTFILGEGGHLWIVISDPAKNGGSFIIANLTTDKWRAGMHCELNCGDHKWITEKCFVNFGDARVVNPAEEARIVALIAAGRIIKHFPIKDAILQKIILAGKQSKALSINKKKYL